MQIRFETSGKTLCGGIGACFLSRGREGSCPLFFAEEINTNRAEQVGTGSGREINDIYTR